MCNGTLPSVKALRCDMTHILKNGRTVIFYADDTTTYASTKNATDLSSVL